MSGKRIKHSGDKKPIALLVSLALVVTAVLGVTIAYLTARDDSITNTFVPGEVSCEVTESLDGTEKKNVCVKNTGDADAYIRAAIVVTWQDEDGNVYAKAPTANDYTMSLNTTDWEKSGDYYYYKSAVVAGTGVTEALINSCTQESDAAVPDGYTLHVEILAQAIQSTPVGALQNTAQYAWGYEVKGGSGT